MPVFAPKYLEQLGTRIFTGCGTPAADAWLVAKALVDANLMGLESHGVIRIRQYVSYVEQGQIVPGAAITVVKETSATAIVDCGKNFGQVGAFKALEIAIRKARENSISCVVTRHCNHVGRLGAYPQKAAEQDMICLLTANGDFGGHFVAPWGGKKGRLATNPLAYDAPTKGYPVLADIATSVLSEGKIRVLLHENQPLPDNAVLDADGKVTRNPGRFYGPPMGAILPFGGEVGYKGFALSLLVEILSGTLAGNAITDETVFGNGLCFIVINPAAFIDMENFKLLMEELTAYMKSTPLAEGFDEILLPGERDFRKMEQTTEGGITLDDRTWEQIVETARGLGVAI